MKSNMRDFFAKCNKDELRKFRKERDDENLADQNRRKEKKKQKYIDERRKQKRNEV